VPDETFETIEGDILHGKVTAGKICPHPFTFELHRDGRILKIEKWEREAEQVQLVKFTIQSASRNIGDEILAVLITAAISETPVIVVGFPAVTLGLLEFLGRVLPEGIDFDAIFKPVSRDEYETLTSADRQKMIVEIQGKKILNSVFDEEQLEWIRRALVRAKMISDQQAAENCIFQEAKKLRMTVSMLKYIAKRRESKPSDSESTESTGNL
jgi:hypothetical protein